MSNESNCPVTGGGRWRDTDGMTNRDWWPHQLDLSLLRQNNPASDPMSKDFDYDEALRLAEGTGGNGEALAQM